MPTTKTVTESRTLLENVRWQTYESLLDDAGESHIRFTYDDGVLEIMTLSFSHENPAKLLGYLVLLLAMELNLPLRSGGSLTLKKQSQRKGLEPDQCYWITNELAMRGKTEFDINSDPPPDLAIAVAITSSSLDRMSIYAALGVKEVWRFDGETFSFYCLSGDGYEETQRSGIFPDLPKTEVLRFLQESTTTDETTLCRSFRLWVREHLLPVAQVKPAKKTSRTTEKKKKPKG